MRAPRLAPCAPLFVLLVMAGCGGGDNGTKPIVPADGLPAGTPQADSPQHLAARLEATWESQVEAEYAKLLTDDFRFHFSPGTDPALVDLYGNDWKRANEIAALTHLFDGFTNSSSQAIPGASTIELTMTGAQYGTDFHHPDSTTHYQRIIVNSFDGTIEVPSSPEPITYQISSRQELYLVRGDAAVLPAGAVADSTRWYVRRWDDISLSFTSRKGPTTNPGSTSSLGKLKADYHDPPPLPLRTPPADSPEHLVERLATAWEYQEALEYAQLLSGDFRFHFSIQTDPALVDRYGDNWGPGDEIEAMAHVFDGFINTYGEPIPGASRIDLTISGVSNQDDPGHADSTAHYRKLVILNMEGTIEVPGSPENYTYNISARQEMYLVRGDAAVLPPAATADPNRWYLRRWDDMATYFASRKGPTIHPATTRTLGSIKAIYR